MPYDISAFKILIKKIFPPKNCIFTLDTTGNGKPDSIRIQATNVIIPFVIPDHIEFEDFNTDNLDLNNIDTSKYVTIFLDNEPINLSKETVNLETLQERIQIFHENVLFTVKDLREGKLSGKTIALGDTLGVIIKLTEDSLTHFNKGKHIFKIESEFITGLEIDFELDEDNMNLSFKLDN